MAELNFNPEFNFYPLDAQSTVSSGAQSTAEQPRANNPPVPDSTTNLTKGPNGVTMYGGTMKSSNYVADVAGWLLDSNGNIYGVAILTQGGRIANWYINTNTISSGSTEATSNVLIDSLNSLIRLGSTSGNYITLDGANLRIRSSNYSAGVSGFTIEPSLIEAENLVARGTMRGVSFKYDVISAVGGQMMVANSDVLASDMTALDSGTMTVKGDSTFAVNDILVIRGIATSGIQEEWFRVTNIGSAPTYTVTRDLAGTFAADSNPTWKAGTPVVKQGSSNGIATYSGGWLRLLGEGTNSPYYSVFARNGVAYNAYFEACRFGNLNGIGSFSSDTYGVFIGNYSSGKYLSFDNVSNDLVINGYVQNRIGTFGGDGSDGVLNVSSGTTTINCGGSKYVVKNYTSISITGTGKVVFSNPHSTGTFIVLKSQGNVILTSSQTPMLDASGMGAAGGASVTNGGGIAFTAGNSGTGGKSLFVTANGGQGGQSAAGGTGGANTAAYQPSIVTANPFAALHLLYVGGGGGSGSASRSSTANPTATSGAGGNGGGAIYIECKGYWNFTTTNGISVAGAAGSNATGPGGGQDGSGGGGGSGGSFVALYNFLTANSGSVTVSGGVGGNKYTSEGVPYTTYGAGGGASGEASGNNGTGSSTNGAKTGADGANGYSLIAMNTLAA